MPALVPVARPPPDECAAELDPADGEGNVEVASWVVTPVTPVTLKLAVVGSAVENAPVPTPPPEVTIAPDADPTVVVATKSEVGCDRNVR